jgi:hypothetical protein
MYVWMDETQLQDLSDMYMTDTRRSLAQDMLCIIMPMYSRTIEQCCFMQSTIRIVSMCFESCCSIGPLSGLTKKMRYISDLYAMTHVTFAAHSTLHMHGAVYIRTEPHL